MASRPPEFTVGDVVKARVARDEFLKGKVLLKYPANDPEYPAFCDICFYSVAIEGRNGPSIFSGTALFLYESALCSDTVGAEESLLSDTGKLWDSFIALPEEHPMERQEFASAIHVIQGLLAMRLCRRSHPEIFPTQK